MLNKGQLKNPINHLDTHQCVKKYIYALPYIVNKSTLKSSGVICCCSDQTQHIINSLGSSKRAPKQKTELQGQRKLGRQTAFLLLRSVRQ